VLIPLFTTIFIFGILPVFLGLGVALFDYNPLNAHNTFIGISNFIRLIHDPTFYNALVKTLYFVIVTTGINLVITLFFAEIISSFKNNKIRSVFRVIFFLPCVAPLSATAFVWRQMYNPSFGLINVLLKRIGMTSYPWLGQSGTVINAIIIFTLWANIGYNIILFCAGIDGIPQDFYEAAIIDGAGPFTRFFKITIPLLAKTTYFVLIMTLITQFQVFTQFETMQAGHGGPNDIGLVLSLLIFRTAFVFKDMGYAAAISLALFILIMIFSYVSHRLNKINWGY
jgi:multiple sugar transport system permease protein/raffinose/stachyose/melibiose transport system permease protein